MPKSIFNLLTFPIHNKCKSRIGDPPQTILTQPSQTPERPSREPRTIIVVDGRCGRTVEEFDIKNSGDWGFFLIGRTFFTGLLSFSNWFLLYRLFPYTNKVRYLDREKMLGNRVLNKYTTIYSSARVDTKDQANNNRKSPRSKQKTIESSICSVPCFAYSSLLLIIRDNVAATSETTGCRLPM